MSAGLALLQSRSRFKLDESQQRALSLAYRMAHSGMVTGRGTEQLWHTLACALAVGRVLTECAVGLEELQIIADAEDAMLKQKAISERSGIWSLGSGGFIVKAALGVLDRQMEQATTAQLTAALRKVFAQVS